MKGEELDKIHPGDIVGPFRVVRRLPVRGGQARVFLAEVRERYRRPELPRRVALKVAPREHQEALETEARYLSRFNHPNVVRIFPMPHIASNQQNYSASVKLPSVGLVWFYAMEYHGGGSLNRRLTRSTTISSLFSPRVEGRVLGVLEVLGIARQLLDALQHIHDHAVVNLDIKPGNILLQQRPWAFFRGSVPHAVLCDFGVSRDTRHPRQGMLGVATPAYVSPEQYYEVERKDLHVDPRSDLFSLGVVLYEMLTGTLPFEGPELIGDPDYVPPPPQEWRKNIPQKLNDVIMRALAKDPAARFQSAREMRAALDNVPQPFDWEATVRRALAIGIVAALIGLGVVFGLGLTQGPPTGAQPTLAPAPMTISGPTAAPALVSPSPMPWTATPQPSARPTSTARPTLTSRPTPRPTSPVPTVPTVTPPPPLSPSPAGGL